MDSGEQVCKAESLNIIPMQSQTLKGAELEEGRDVRLHLSMQPGSCKGELVERPREYKEHGSQQGGRKMLE